MNSVGRTFNNILVNKALFCQTKQLSPLVISGASGAGKGTLFTMLKSRNTSLFELSVSCTTRNPRKGENHSEHYHFISQEEFKHDAFAEHCFVHGNYYGTLTEQVFSFMKQGKICVLDIDVQGAEKIYKKFPHWNYIFVNFPSRLILEERLRSRGTETEEQIQTRLNNSLKEIDHKNTLGFYHEITNHTKEQAYSDILSYLTTVYPHLTIN